MYHKLFHIVTVQLEATAEEEEEEKKKRVPLSSLFTTFYQRYEFSNHKYSSKNSN